MDWKQSDPKLHSPKIREALEKGDYNLRFEYGGFQRLVTPWTLFVTKNGSVQIMAYQYGGRTSSGEIEDPLKGQWRAFSLEKISPELTLFRGERYPAITDEMKKSEWQPSKGMAEVLARYIVK